jgi:sulfonate transport system substrate-binding protein
MTMTLRQRHRHRLTAVALLATLLAAGAAGCSAGGTKNAGNGAGGGSGPVIRTGWQPLIQWTHIGDLPSFAKRFRVKLSPFKTSNDTLVAMYAGSLDIAGMGYNQAAAAIARGKFPYTFVAGASSGSSRFIARKGVKIRSWDDLRGKRLGITRGTTQATQLAAAAAKHGLNLDRDTKLVNIGDASALEIALENGSIDAAMLWEPRASDAILRGFAADVPVVRTSLYPDSFRISSGIIVSDKFLHAHPDLVQRFVDSYYASWRKVTSDRSYWVESFLQKVPGDQKATEMASRNTQPDFAMDQHQIESMANLLYRQHIIDHNVTKQLVAKLDYRFISKASGKQPSELGQVAGS